MKPKSLLVAIILALACGVLAISLVYAQQLQPTPSDDQVNAIAKQLYCPVCENTPLDVCPTTACAQWRELIRQKLGEGWSEQQIKSYFVQQYGDRVLGTPPPKGINWIVYLVPPLAVMVGVYILFRVYRSWKSPAQVSSTPPPADKSALPQDASQDEYIRMLEEEVRKREA